MRLIAANVPLRHGRRTIGECDFLLENAQRTRLHWELAVKFYLHIVSAMARRVPRVCRITSGRIFRIASI